MFGHLKWQLGHPVLRDTLYNFIFWYTLQSRPPCTFVRPCILRHLFSGKPCILGHPVFWDLYVYFEWTYILGHFVFWHPYCFRTTCILKTLSFWSVEYNASGTQRFLGHPVLWKKYLFSETHYESLIKCIKTNRFCSIKSYRQFSRILHQKLILSGSVISQRCFPHLRICRTN